MDFPPVNSIKQCEKLLGLSHTALYGAINSGLLRTYKVGRRRFATGEALVDFIRAREAEERRARRPEREDRDEGEERAGRAA